MQVLFPGSPCWTRTNDPFCQKHSRLARLERVAMLLVSSCSEHRFICRRQRGAPSQLTVVVTRISNSVIRFHTVYNRVFSHITQLINGSRGAKNR